MTDNEFRLVELIRGVTHWKAWMTAEQVASASKTGWSILREWEMVLCRNSDGVLVPPDSLSLR